MFFSEWTKLVGKVIRTPLCPGHDVLVVECNEKEVILESEFFAEISSMGTHRIVPIAAVKNIPVTCLE